MCLFGLVKWNLILLEENVSCVQSVDDPVSKTWAGTAVVDKKGGTLSGSLQRDFFLDLCDTRGRPCGIFNMKPPRQLCRQLCRQLLPPASQKGLAMVLGLVARRRHKRRQHCHEAEDVATG